MTTLEQKTETAPVTLVPIALAVERCGIDVVRHDILQVGLATGPSIDKISTASYCFNHPGALRFEKKCKDELWTGKLEVLERIQSECKDGESVSDTWQTLRIAWDGMTKDDRVVFVTDNDYMDMGAIHHGFETHCPRISTLDGESHVPPRFSLSGQMRQLLNPYQVVKGFGAKREAELMKELDKLQPQTHWAPDDARRCLILYFLYMREIGTLSAGAPTPTPTPAPVKPPLLDFETMISGFDSSALG